MRALTTPLLPVWTKKTTSATPGFQPLTAAINTTFIKDARISKWIEAATPAFVATVGYQMSNDGNDWTTTPTAVGSYVSTSGWVYDTAASPTAVTTDQRLFVRFGIMSANSSGTDLQQALARLHIEPRPVEGKTLAIADVKVFTQGSTTPIFHPLVGPIRIEAVGEHRPTLRLFHDSGLLSVQPAYQVSNDGYTWDNGEGGAADSAALFGSARTTDGTDYGTTFTSFAPTNRKQFVRWGVAAKNESGTIAEAGLVSLRIDSRRTT